MELKPAVVRANEHAPSWMGCDLVRPLLPGPLTGGQFAVWHASVRKGCGSPPHMHRREDEAFYILSGEVTFMHGDRLLRAGAGSFVWAPRDVPHCFTGSSDEPARMLLMVTPTAFETFAAGFCTPATDPNAWPDMQPEAIQTLLRTAPDYGIEIFPPTFAMPTRTDTAAAADRRRWVMGEHVTYLATADQTAGQFTVVEILTAPAGGPPPHAHTREDEVLYVIEGQHEVELNGRVDTAGPGDLVWMPRGTRHRYTNTGTATGKILSLHTPGGFEKFFDEAGVDAARYPVDPKLPPPPRETVAALLTRHGMTF